MGRRSKDLRTMNEIVEVRLAQRLAAKMRATQAAEALRELGRRREECLERLEGDQTSWSVNIQARSLDLPLAQSWSIAILQGQANLQGIDAEVEDAQGEWTQRTGDWRKSIARSDAAEDLARVAFKTVMRHREETALGDLADRIARRGAAQ